MKTMELLILAGVALVIFGGIPKFGESSNNVISNVNRLQQSG